MVVRSATTFDVTSAYRHYYNLPQNQRSAKTNRRRVWSAAAWRPLVVVQVPQGILDCGVSCGPSSYDRGSKMWVAELVCGAANKTISMPSPGIKLFHRDPVGEPAVAAVPSVWYEQIEGTSHGKVFLVNQTNCA